MKKRITVAIALLAVLCVFAFTLTACNNSSNEAFNIAKQALHKYDYLANEFYEFKIVNVEYAIAYNTSEGTDGYCFKAEYKYKYSAASPEYTDVFCCLAACQNSTITKIDSISITVYNAFCNNFAEKTGSLTKQQVQKLN